MAIQNINGNELQLSQWNFSANLGSVSYLLGHEII